MSSDFVRQVRAFLDLEAHGGGYTEYALDVAYDFLNDDKEGDSFVGDSEGIRSGELASFNAIREKVFPDISANDVIGQGTDLLEQVILNKRNEKSNVNGEMLHGFFDQEQKLLELLAAKMGLSVKEAQEYLEQAAEGSRIKELRSPTLHRFLLRKYLARLDKMVDDIDALESLPVAWNSIPAHLQTLLSNAHEAALLGQEVACAILCGTALEEALKIHLGRDRFEGISAGIRTAVGEGLFGKNSPEELAARDVKQMRDEATHDPGSYLATPNRKKRDVLINTRFILAQMFAGKR